MISRLTPAFCASCTEERDDLVVDHVNAAGHQVWMCSDCATGELRGGHWSFDGGTPRSVNLRQGYRNR